VHSLYYGILIARPAKNKATEQPDGVREGSDFGRVEDDIRNGEPL